MKVLPKAAVRDIKDDKFWKCIYIFLCAVFPALRLLCYCDKNKPTMDKIFFLSHRTTVALEKSEEFLNDKSLVGSLKIDGNLTKEGNKILGGTGVADADSSDDDNIIFDDTTPNLRTRVMLYLTSLMLTPPLNWT